MEVKSIFGANLKVYRKRKLLSQEELAVKIDISPKHLSKIERGVSFVTAPLLDRIICVLDVSPSSLFYTPERNDGNGDKIILESIVDEMEKALSAIKVRINRL